MKSDYIVPEAFEPKAPRRSMRIGLMVVALGLALYLCRDVDMVHNGAVPQSNTANGEITLIRPSAEKSPSRFLSDLSPIGQAQAMATPPETEALTSPGPTENVLGDIDEAIASLKNFSDAPAEVASKTTNSKVLTVRSGDSLSILFDSHALKAADWMSLTKLTGDAKRLSRLQPGDTLHLELNDENEIVELALRLNDMNTLHVHRSETGTFNQTVTKDTVETREVAVTGTIRSSLFLSAKAAGLSDRVTMELTDIFAWDVDFALDIRVGDSYRVIYEEIYREGEKLKDGNILAAEFVNRGNTIRAVRYSDESGRTAYYSPDGEPMKKAFLRSPVDFTRISSRFSTGRKHPILNKIRAHKGVDYAAPRGTPIKAAGSGKVIFAGIKGGYGNVLILQHAGKYTTLYAHLQGFRRGIHRGSSVSQGQTIAYVGSSGLATGPHLHYEFQVNHRHVNPLTVKLPSAPKIAASKLAHFKLQTALVLTKLESAPAHSATEVATAQ
jgi:murein DD-endopeptidase MepM/ murein hydrolase activator NlpD